MVHFSEPNKRWTNKAFLKMSNVLAMARFAEEITIFHKMDTITAALYFSEDYR